MATKIPFTHQNVGAKWLLTSRNTLGNGQRLRGRILADKMGLGKTLTALLAAKVHKADNAACRIIVIAPKSLLSNWKDEARDAGVEIEVFSDHVASFPKGITGSFIVINDESHRFQNPDSKRTRQLLGLVSGTQTVKHKSKDENTGKTTYSKEFVNVGDAAESVYLLTGTPIKNGRPHNLIPLLQCINHGIVEGWNLRSYLNTYCDPQQIFVGGRTITTYNGATNCEELHERTKDCILRRETEDCIDLPELTRTLRKMELDDKETAEYASHLARLKQEYKRRLMAGEIKGGGDKIVLLNQLRLVGSVAKVRPACDDMIDEILEEGGSVVIFTCFRQSATAIATRYNVPCYDGSTSTTQRDTMVKDFQEGRQRVFVGIDKAGGVGLTLHAFGKCRNVILLDRPWTPGDALQLEKRSHRIGQPNAVHAAWCQYGAIDQKIDAVLADKFENTELILTGQAVPIDFAKLADDLTDELGWND